MTNKRLIIIVPIIVALIAAISAIIVEVLKNKDISDTKNTDPPTISISNDVRDTNGNPIAINSAPFEVKVSGTVSNADGLYVYLIVANPYDHYVQPGLGQGIDGDFSAPVYLGIKENPDGLPYTIYAVVTDKPYAIQASFKGESYVAKSKEIKLTRESSLTP
jgi:hypothetical protein